MGTCSLTQTNQRGAKTAPQMALVRYPEQTVGFGPLCKAWAPRLQLAGTYDDDWLEQRHPYLPKDKPEAAPKKSESNENGGAKSQGKCSVDKGKCGEWLAKMDMAEQGFDQIVAVQNNSGHGVDLIGRNSSTGEVKVWEVKTTKTASAPSLSKE